MITLNEQQLTELNQFCQELPTKYGVPLLQWFKQIQDEQNPKTEAKDPFNNPNDPNAGLG
jgi:hypothetical protein